MEILLKYLIIFISTLLCLCIGFSFPLNNYEEELDTAVLSSEPSYLQSDTVTASEENSSPSEEAVQSIPEEDSKPAESSGNAPAAKESKVEEPNPQPPIVTASSVPEKRAVWISFLEYQKILKNKTEREFRNTVCEYLNKCAEYGLNTVIVHARSHGDAYYKSAYFPASVNFTGNRNNTFSFDPLKIMTEEAHKRSLKIEAWVNPYRGNKTADGFAPDDPVAKWLGTEKVFKWGNPETGNEYYYFNPGEPEVQKLIIKGIIEIVDNYDIDGIHFDDYFYPTADASIDTVTFEKYGGGRALNEFRTDCVNELVSAVYREIKARKNITFGISPAGNVDSCINKSFADVRLWGSSEGYVDYIMPQIYWDYGEGSLPFEAALSAWRETVTNPNIKLAVGLAAYKVTDKPADYWSSGDVLKRQVQDLRTEPNYIGFSIFRYEDLFSDRLKTERENLKEILG